MCIENSFADVHGSGKGSRGRAGQPTRNDMRPWIIFFRRIQFLLEKFVGHKVNTLKGHVSGELSEIGTI